MLLCMRNLKPKPIYLSITSVIIPFKPEQNYNPFTCTGVLICAYMCFLGHVYWVNVLTMIKHQT